MTNEETASLAETREAYQTLMLKVYCPKKVVAFIVDQEGPTVVTVLLWVSLGMLGHDIMETARNIEHRANVRIHRANVYVAIA